ncbi:MAG: ABC transporter ATP-binding protein/permease [Lachnospiraceae bacterium]|nr:ABC transporter ATP-binding protein/permease [Lachnospiraceae bacterium]
MKKTVRWSAFCGYLKYIWKEKKILYLYGVIFFPAFITANYLQVFLPKMIIQKLEDQTTIPNLGLSILVLILLLLLCIIIREKMRSQTIYGNRQIEQKMQNDYTDKLLYVDYGYLEDADFLSIRNMAKESLFGGSIGSQERAQLMDFMPTLIMITAALGNAAIYLFYLGKLSWPLIILLFATIFLGTALNMKLFRKNEGKYGQMVSDSWQKMDYVTRKTQDFSMAKDIRLYHMNSWLSGLVNGYLKERLRLKKKELSNRGIGDMVYVASLTIFQVAVLGMVLHHFLHGKLAVSDVIFYVNMTPALYNLLDQEVSTKSMHLFRILTEFQRFQDFIQYGEDTGKQNVPVRKEAPEISLEHVSFSYPKSDKTVLRDINLTVRAGEKVAIVGINGAGKTTLMKLICGLLHPTSGRILLNGVDMETMEAEERYAWFSCTFQDVQFLPVSIRENLSQETTSNHMLENQNTAAGTQRSPGMKSNIPSKQNDTAIWNCLEQAGIRQEVEELPEKLDTLLEKSIHKNATDFSGGQRQKLILARALFRNGGALILDEPTAALDALAENEIYEKYAEFAAEKTSFFVSHRLSSTRFCDRILLLEGGNIAEEGTHQELLDKEGIYADMFAVQSKYYQ